jgi:hypothetical protein
MFQRIHKASKPKSRIILDKNGYWRDERGRFATAPPKVDAWGLARVGSVLAVAGALTLALGQEQTNNPISPGFSAPLTIHELARAPEPARIIVPVSQARSTKARDCLVQLAYHEARSETGESIVKRIWTAVWRARRDDFKANTICQAVFQRGAFSAFLKGVPPMKDKVALARVSKIVDSQMPAILPDLYGGTDCVEVDEETNKCAQTVADNIPVPPVMTHYAEADCYYLGRRGYRYVKRPGRCEPRWAAKMQEIASVKCAAVKRRRCATVFWLTSGKS